MILDTNVVSEPMQAFPDVKVMAWLDQLDLTSCFITAITAAELLAGVQRLPPGKKRNQLNLTVEHVVYDRFSGRVLMFDLAAAEQFATALEKLRSVGLNGMHVDVMIAAVALVHNMRVASRDRRPYEATGVEVINPWTDT